MNNDEKYLKRLKDTIDIGNILQENIQRDKELFSKFKAYSSSLSVFPEYGKLPDSLTFNISSSLIQTLLRKQMTLIML